ncbi:MAG TPA: substrate-binding domain-containing protein [Anaerolineales bacterium]|nr:substrate-binding domain-containing protein [Anaerolineales bacterium]
MPDRARGLWAQAILLLGALTACGPAPTPSLPPQPARLAVTPALGAFAFREFAAWREEAGVPDFDLEIWPEAAALQAADEGEVAAILALSAPPEGWFAAPVGVEAIAVIVNPENPVRALDLEALAQIFSGRAQTWASLGGPAEPVSPVIPLPGDGLRAGFEDQVMGGAALSGGAFLAPSPEAALTIVAQNTGAIGLIPLAAADDRARLVRIDGVLPSDETLQDGRYPLALPVLMISPEEPSGAIRDWIVWLQALEGT